MTDDGFVMKIPAKEQAFHINILCFDKIPNIGGKKSNLKH